MLHNQLQLHKIIENASKAITPSPEKGNLTRIFFENASRSIARNVQLMMLNFQQQSQLLSSLSYRPILKYTNDERKKTLR